MFDGIHFLLLKRELKLNIVRLLVKVEKTINYQCLIEQKKWPVVSTDRLAK